MNNFKVGQRVRALGNTAFGIDVTFLKPGELGTVTLLDSRDDTVRVLWDNRREGSDYAFWHYEYEVEAMPKQPKFKAGDRVVSVNGQALGIPFSFLKPGSLGTVESVGPNGRVAVVRFDDDPMKPSELCWLGVDVTEVARMVPAPPEPGQRVRILPSHAGKYSGSGWRGLKVGEVYAVLQQSSFAGRDEVTLHIDGEHDKWFAHIEDVEVVD